MFDKLNQRIEELKDRLQKTQAEKFDESENETEQENQFGYVDEEMGAQQQEPTFERKNSDLMIDMCSGRQQIYSNDKERNESDVTVVCTYCKESVIGPPHIMRANNRVIQISGALYNHWSTACTYFDEYHQKLKTVATEALKYQKELLQAELQLTLTQNEDQVLQCFKLSVAFDQTKAELATFLNDSKVIKKESYPFLVVAIENSADSVIINELEFLQKFGKLAQQSYHHKSEGYMRLLYGKLVNVTQQTVYNNTLTIANMQEFRYRCAICKKLFSCEAGWSEHAEFMLRCGRTCICDVFSFAKYSHSLKETSAQHFQREVGEKELHKLEALIANTMENLELIKPEKFKSALETRRDVQREDSLQFVDQNKGQLTTVESWLTSLSSESEKDSDNQYTAELMKRFQKSLDDLASKIIDAVPPSKLQKSIIQNELSNLYIRQTDYTKDYFSFLVVKSLNKNFDVLRQIGDRIGIPFSEAHSQLLTSIQFQSFAQDASGQQIRVQRIKAYNKWVHLLLTTSFKAALSMGTSKLFKGPAAFHMDKLQPSFNDGLLRIELSSYYYSVEQWKSEALQMQQWNQTITSMESALHEVEEQLLYKVSLKVLWDSFWFSVDAATVIIDFQVDLWTVVYAYSSRSYLYTGHYTDKHAKSGAKLTFFQRFAGAKTVARVCNGQKSKEIMIYRHGHSRQIPIGSLNVKKFEENRMTIDMAKWIYHFSKGQLDQIFFACDNQQEFDEWLGQDHALQRPETNDFENHNDRDEMLQKNNASQQDNTFTCKVDLASNKKREVKLNEKKRDQIVKVGKRQHKCDER